MALTEIVSCTNTLNYGEVVLQDEPCVGCYKVVVVGHRHHEVFLAQHTIGEFLLLIGGTIVLTVMAVHTTQGDECIEDRTLK